MATTTSGTTGQATTVSAGGATRNTWGNIDNIKVEDGTVAYNVPTAASTNNDFARLMGALTSIPATNVIKGITVKIKKRQYGSGTGSVYDQAVNIVLSTGAVATNKAQAGVWPTTDTFFTYGGPTDTWGLSNLTGADINAGFGAQLQCYAVGEKYAAIDKIQLIIDHEPAPTKVDTIVTEDSSTSFVMTTNDATINQSERVQATTAEYVMVSGDHEAVSSVPTERVPATTASFQMSSDPANLNNSTIIQATTAEYALTSGNALLKATDVIKAETTKYVMSSDNHSTGGASTVTATTAGFELTTGVHGVRNFLPARVQSSALGYPQTGVAAGSGWTNLANATGNATPDSNHAFFDAGGPNANPVTSPYAIFYNFNFNGGLNVPDNATDINVTLRLWKNCNGGTGATDVSVVLVKRTTGSQFTVLSEDKADLTTPWTITTQEKVYTFSTQVSAADIRSSNFGFAIRGKVPAGQRFLNIDGARISASYIADSGAIRVDASPQFVMTGQDAQINQMTRMSVETTAYVMSETNHVAGIFKRLTMNVNEQSTLEALIKRRRSSSIVPIAEHAVVSNMSAGRNRKVISLNTNRSTVTLGNSTRVRNPVVTITETARLSTAGQRRREIAELMNANVGVVVRTKRHRKVGAAITEQSEIEGRMGRLLLPSFGYSASTAMTSGEFDRYRGMPFVVPEVSYETFTMNRVRVPKINVPASSGWFFSPIKGIIKEFSFNFDNASLMTIVSDTMRIRGNTTQVHGDTASSATAVRERQAPTTVAEKMVLTTKANRERLVSDEITVKSAVKPKFNRSLDVSSGFGDASAVMGTIGRTRETPFGFSGQITWANEFIRTARGFGLNVETDSIITIANTSVKPLGVVMPGNSDFVFGPLINTKTLEMAPINTNVSVTAEFARFRTAAAEFVIETEVDLAIERLVTFAASLQGSVETEIELDRARELIALVAEQSGLVVNTEVLPYQNTIVVKITEYKTVEVNGTIKIQKEVTTGRITKIEYMKIQVDSLDDLG